MTSFRRNVQAALLHPHPAVREAALRHFVESLDPSPALLPAMIKAATRYPSHAQALLFQAKSLTHTRFTFQWILDQMRKPWDENDREQSNYRFTLARLLLEAPAEELLKHRKEILAVRAIPSELEVAFDDTLKMHRASWNTLWNEFRDEQRTGLDPDREARFIRAMARHRAKAPFVLRLMQDDSQGEEPEFLESLDATLIELAGLMQIRAAVPIIFGALADGLDHLHGSARQALLRLGKHETVHEIIRRWPALSQDGRGTYGHVLSVFHTKKATEFGLKVFLEEPDSWTRMGLATAVLEHFAPETILPVYQYLLDDKQARKNMLFAIPRHLVTVAMVTGKRFDDYDNYVERMDAQYQLERELGNLETTWLADEYEESVAGPAYPRKLVTKTSKCFLLKVSFQGLGYLGRLQVPDLNLEDLHEALMVASGGFRFSLYRFHVGKEIFSNGRGSAPQAHPRKKWLSEVTQAGATFEYFNGAMRMHGLNIKVLRTKDANESASDHGSIVARRKSSRMRISMAYTPTLLGSSANR
jgi:hypothetical protein